MKILLVQTGFLGDVVLATPLIEAIKAKHHNCHLWILTTPIASKLFVNDSKVDGVIAFDKRNEYKGYKGLIKFSKIIADHKFDTVYSLHKSLRTSILLKLSGIKNRVGFKNAKASFLYNTKIVRPYEKHDVLRNLSLLELSNKEQDLYSNLRLIAPQINDLSTDIRDFLESLAQKNRPYFVIAPGSVWKTKRYHANGYREVVKYLNSVDINVVLVGGPDEIAISNEVAKDLIVNNFTGKTNIQELLAIIANSECVICNDSMTLHVASAFKKKVVVSFCATSPEFGFGPWKTKFKIVQKEGLSCKPCMRHGSNSCPTGTNACMTFSSNKIVNAIKELFNEE